MAKLCAPDGLIIINKSKDITSQGVVSRTKRLLSSEKAGHTGTLDPLATGVLPVLLGRAVKASEYMLTEDKHYGAVLLLGVTSDTEDITGELKTGGDVPTADKVFSVISEFCGEIMQTPPMYSALKVGGKKLCDLARDGITVEREPRKVKVYSIDAKQLSEREYYLDVVCSKGTYIRTLCADIGARLGSGGVMKELVRLSAAGFKLDDAISLDELENMTDEERLQRVIPVERVFEKYRAVTLPDFFSRLAHSGLEIYIKKIGITLDVHERVRLCDKNGFFALGEVREFEAGLAIKPIKQFG